MQDNNSNLHLASMRSRAFAYIIDDLIVTTIVMIVFWENIIGLGDDMEAMMFLIKTDLVMPLIMLKILYHTFFVWYYGATIGKIINAIFLFLKLQR